MDGFMKHILLVEDSLNDAELTLEALRSLNLINGVIHVRDGQEALDYLQCVGDFAGRAGGDPAVMLLDLKMPRVDGIEVLRRVKSDPKLRSVPIVMLTSSREEIDLVTSYDLGVNAYVVKPVEFTQFVKAISDLGLFWGVVNEPPPSSRG